MKDKIKYYLRKISCFFRIRFQGNKSSRLEAYKKCLEILNSEYISTGTMRGLCYLLNAQDYKFKNNETVNYKEIYKLFPELYIYKPFKHGAFWFTSDNKRGYEIRKKILEKA